MNAIRRAKIYARERTRLETVIPLPMPYSLQIDICSACNMKCDFCFHSDVEAIKNANIKFGYMSYDLFTCIIDNIKMCWGGGRIARLKKLRLFKAGEPLLNPYVCQMVEYAKKADIAECIEITTNGTLLDEKMSLGLIEAGLDILNISVNGIDEKQYRDVCGYDMDFGEFRKKIDFFYRKRNTCKVFIKYSDIGYSQEQKNQFYDLFENICDEIFVETISATLWQGTNVGEKISDMHRGTYGQEMKMKWVCPFLFTTMVINHEGVAHLCCADWKTEYVLGDLKKDRIEDIWNGKVLKKYQILHLSRKKNEIPICIKCESLSANTIDDIDEYADMLLDKISNSQ